MRSGWLCAAIVGLLLARGSALAETAEQECQRLSDEAVDAYKQARYQRAAELLERAFAIRPLTPLLYNLGKAYDKINDADKAYGAYKRYVDSGEADPKLEEKARKRMEFYEPKLSKAKPEPERPPPQVEPEKPKGPTPEELQGEENARRKRFKLIALIGGAAVAGVGAACIIGGGATYASAAAKNDQYGRTFDETTKRQLEMDGRSTGSASSALYGVGIPLLAIGAASIVISFVLPQLQPVESDKVAVLPWLDLNAGGSAGANVSWRF